jgi:NADH:ubiquinone oxidoreductase subunit C
MCCRTLRDKFEYQQLMEIAGVDYPGARSGSTSSITCFR